MYDLVKFYKKGFKWSNNDKFKWNRIKDKKYIKIIKEK